MENIVRRNKGAPPDIVRRGGAGRALAGDAVDLERNPVNTAAELRLFRIIRRWRRELLDRRPFERFPHKLVPDGTGEFVAAEAALHGLGRAFRISDPDPGGEARRVADGPGIGVVIGRAGFGCHWPVLEREDAEGAERIGSRSVIIEDA